MLSVAGSGFSGGTWITLAGELDMQAVDVHGHVIRVLVVPATASELIDLSGARLLLELDVQVRSGGARMRLVASKPIRRLLQLMDARELLAGQETLEPRRWPDDATKGWTFAARGQADFEPPHAQPLGARR